MRKMKDSGIAWIGDIPEEWKVVRFRFIADITTGNQDTQNADPDGEYPFYVRSPIVERCRNYTFEGESILMAGDGAGAGRVFHLVSGKYAVHQRVYRFYNIKHINSTLLKYYLETLFATVMDYGSAKTTVPSVRLPMIQDFYVCVPPQQEQDEFLFYLDEKCGKIDALVLNVKAQIERLKAYKQSLITEVVTKGLNPFAPMKESGIAWIGKIPEEWTTIKIKFTSWLKGRIGWDGLTSAEFIDDGPYLITGTDFKDGIINWDTCVHITEKRFNEDELLHIRESDLLITKDGTIGKLAIVKNCPEKVSLNSGVMIIRNTKNFKYIDKFLYYILQSNQFLLWYELSQSGNSTIRHLYQKQFYNFEFTYPPLVEQRAIADYLDEKCGKIDALIGVKERKIAALEAYKKSLIYECVTGKREVI